MKTYKCTPAFGWGAAGPAISDIRHQLRKHGLENKAPPRFVKMHELIVPYPVDVTGKDEAVTAFGGYMRAMGYDDRACDA